MMVMRNAGKDESVHGRRSTGNEYEAMVRNEEHGFFLFDTIFHLFNSIR